MVIWILNMLGMALNINIFARDFSDGTSVRTDWEEVDFTSDAVELQLGKDFYKENWYMIGDLRISEKGLVSDQVHLNIKKSENDRFSLYQEVYSRGRNSNEAESLAQSIEFELEQLENGAFNIPRHFSILKGKKWRAQDLTLTLLVPVGKSIKLDKNIHRIIREIDLEDRHVGPWKYRESTWQMGPDGLVCFNCYDGDSSYKRFPYENFSSILIQGNLKTTIEKKDGFKVSLDGNSNHLDNVSFKLEGQQLIISSDHKESLSPLRLTIGMPQLDLLVLNNTSDTRIKDFEQSKLNLRSTGTQELKADIKIDSIFVIQEGNNEVDLRGSARFLKADLANKAVLDADKFNIETAAIKAVDASKAMLMVQEELWKNADESSSIINEGQAKVVEQ